MLDLIKKNAFARNSLVLFAGSMIINVLNYIFHLVLGRMVSVELYGEVESLISLSHIISVPALALTMVVTKYSSGAKSDNDRAGTKEILKLMTKKVLTFGLPLILVALLTTPLIKGFLKIDQGFPIVLIWTMMFVSFFSAINNGILTGWQKFGQLSIVGVSSALIKLAVVIIFVKLSFGLSGILGAFLLSSIAGYIGTLFVMKFILIPNGTPTKKEEGGLIDFVAMKKYVLPALIGTLTVTILGNADMVLAKHKLDAITSGEYGALTIMSKAIFYATGAIATVLFSMSSEENHKKQKSTNAFRNSLILTAVVSLCAILIYFAFPKTVISIFFGEKYFSVAKYLGWFAIFAVLYSFANLFIQYLLSIHKTRSVWSFLAITIVGLASVFIWGTDIRAIITMVSLTQIMVIIMGIWFVFLQRPNLKDKKHK